MPFQERTERLIIEQRAASPANHYVLGRHRTLLQRLRGVGDNQVGVESHEIAEAIADGAGAVGAVEAEGAGLDLLDAGAALRTGVMDAVSPVVPDVSLLS